jgi:ribosomal protein S18 acetylase RimI-like enzyme
MPITIRRAEAADAAQCGAILYTAFQRLADEHNFARDFPSVEVATGVVSMLLANPGFYGIVADGRIVGSNFADHRSSIAGIGPISIDPEVQNQGIGRKLMQAAIDHLRPPMFLASDSSKRPTITAPSAFTRGWASRRGSRCRSCKDRPSLSNLPDTM